MNLDDLKATLRAFGRDRTYDQSAEVIIMLNSAFEAVGARNGDYYPDELRSEIDDINAFVYENVNNGVYRAGFATTQASGE
jgi:glutathionyl-hydroquinone reductase